MISQENILWNISCKKYLNIKKKDVRDVHCKTQNNYKNELNKDDNIKSYLKQLINPKQDRERGKRKPENKWDKQKTNSKMIDFSSVQSLNHVRLMDCSTLGLPVHHQLPEFTQTHVHWVGDAIQPSHPLSSPSPPAFSLSQHRGLFKWVSSSHQMVKVFKSQLQHQSFQWILKTDFL